MKTGIRNLIKLLIILITQSSVYAQSKIWTLQKCLDQAIEKNVLLNQEKLGNDINSINLEQSKANRFPNLNVAENQNFSFGRAIDPVSNQFLNQNISSNNLSLNSSVTIFNGLQNYYTIKQNQYYCNAGTFDLEKAKNDLSLTVVGAYLQILYSYEAVDIAKTQVETSVSQVDRIQKYIDAGKVAIGNLYQMQSQLAADKYSEITAENQLQLAKVDLMQLMEMQVSRDFEIEKPALAEPELANTDSSADIYKIAEQNQPQIKSVALKINSANAGLKVAQGSLMPKLSLQGSLKTAYSSARDQISYQTVMQQQTIGYLQSNPSDLVIGYVPSTVTQTSKYPFEKQFQDNFSQAIGLNLSIPIFNNMIVKNNIAKAKINLQSVQLDEVNIKNQLRKNIEQAYADQLGAAKQYLAAKEEERSEERSYSDMEKKFENGVVNATDFLIEKNNYNKVKQALIQAKYNYTFKTKVIDFYLGKPLTTL